MYYDEKECQGDRNLKEDSKKGGKFLPDTGLISLLLGFNKYISNVVKDELQNLQDDKENEEEHDESDAWAP